MKVIDLFSGAGGMSAGFLRQGSFSIVAAVDLQKGKPGLKSSPGTSTMCNPTYERNLGIRPKDADLAILDPRALLDEVGLMPRELDVLISCAPCTGFSQKNARNHSFDDPRNSLAVRTADFVEIFRPACLVMENVKEFLVGNQTHHYRRLREHLEKLGYKVWAGVHDLTSFGLPQRRRRALLIAMRDRPLEPLRTRIGPVRTVRDAIGHLPPICAGETHPEDPMHVSPSITPKVLDRLRAIPRDGGSWRDIMDDKKLSESRKRELLTPAMFRARPGSFPDVYGRLWWDRPAITVTRECAHLGNGRYAHPEQDRLLTVREMALLQGFPADYIFEGPITARYNQIGDAVPPLVAEEIAKHIATLLTPWQINAKRSSQALASA